MEKSIMFAKKQRARHLVVHKGCTHKEAAQVIGISENTITKWSQKHDWEKAIEEKVQKALVFSDFLDEHQFPDELKGHEIVVKRFLAAYLITVQGQEQKQTAKQLNVSENTISRWSKAGKWKLKRKQALLELKNLSSEEKYTTIKKRLYGLEKSFCEYLAKSNPAAFYQVRLAWAEYATLQEGKLKNMLNIWRDKQSAFGNESVISETPPVSTGGSSYKNGAHEN